MFARLKRRMRLRPYSTTARLFFATALLLLAVSRLADETGLLIFTSRLDTLSEPAAGETLTTVTWHFRFQRGMCSVDVDIPANTLESETALRTSSVFSSRGSVRERYVRRLVDALSGDAVVERLIVELRDTRDRLGLDSDEYLELMVAAVQAIPYGVADRDIELPAEMLVAGQGVCTEKSLLLGAMLVHEGYETVMWAFDHQHHVALGVAGNGAYFRGTRYAFIETTAVRYIGQVEPKYTANSASVAPPALIGRVAGVRVRLRDGLPVAPPQSGRAGPHGRRALRGTCVPVGGRVERAVCTTCGGGARCGADRGLHHGERPRQAGSVCRRRLRLAGGRHRAVGIRHLASGYDA